MTSKEFLRQAYRLDQRIESDLRELDDLRRMSTSISSVDYSADRVQASPRNEAPFVRALAQIEEMSNKINREIDRLVDLKAEIRNVIDAVEDPDEKMLLRYRYINFDTWEHISDALGQSIRWTHILHARALESVEEIRKKLRNRAH